MGTNRLGIGTFITDETEVGSGGLDIFSTPPIDKTIIHGKTVYYYPTSAVTDTGPYEFLLPADSAEYTYLPLTRLEGELEVVKTNGTTLTDTEVNSIVNLFPSTLFRQVECEINGTQICDLSTPTYPYKSYIETHLSFGDEAKNTHLKCEMYRKDQLGKEETFSITGEENKVFKADHAKLKAGKFSFSSILHVDFFQSQRYLIPGCNTKLKFIRNEDKFSLLGAALASKIKVHNLRLSVRKLTVDPQIHANHEKNLETTPAIYPIVQSKIKSTLLASGIQNERITNIYRGKLPRFLLVGLVSAKGFDGDVTKNPFYFRHFDVNYLQLYNNGEPIMGQVFQPDFATGNCIREYRWFMDNIGVLHGDQTNGITFDEFKTNSTFFCFDLSPDLCNNYHMHGSIQGSMDLQIGFKNALTENVMTVFYGSFNEAILIDKDRNVTIT